MGVKTNTAAITAVGEQINNLGSYKEQFAPIFEVLQNGGSRKNYGYFFGAGRFNDETFYPKYDMVPYGQYDGDGAYQMFYKFNSGREPFNLRTRLEECGVILDTSQATSVQQMFTSSYITEVPTIDMQLCVKNRYSIMQTFSYAPYLYKVEKIIVSPSTFFATESFQQAYALVEIRVEGTIAGGTSLDLGWSKKLSKESIISFVQALSDDVAPYTATFSKDAVNKAFETSAGANDGSSSQEWENLMATKPHWAFALVVK